MVPANCKFAGAEYGICNPPLKAYIFTIFLLQH